MRTKRIAATIVGLLLCLFIAEAFFLGKHMVPFFQGRQEMNAGQHNAAIASFTRAIEASPNFAPAYEGRALAMKELYDYAGAIRDLDKAIELDPTDAEYYNIRSWLHWSLRDYEKALADANQAISLRKEEVLGYSNRAAAYLEMKQFDKLKNDAEFILSKEPKNSEAQLSLVVAKYKLGDTTGALSDLDAHMKAHNKDPLYNELAYYLGKINRYEQVLSVLDEGLDKKPIDPWLITKRGDALTALGRLDEAIRTYDLAISLEPRYVRAYAARARALRLSGENDRAALDEAKAKQHGFRLYQ